MANTPPQKRSDSATTPTVKWDDSNMTSNYANVANVASTREEITLLFGTNTAWKGSEDEVTVELSNRLTLSPYAAKRLSILLGNVVEQYEKRFGSLDATPTEKPAAKT